jgi:glycine/D-amino acid oxidase-like deaminating enzyme
VRVAVVGAGIHGLAVAWGLARLGHRVTVLDQAAIPNPLASSYDRHRLIRHAYGARDGYVRMASEAYQAWQALWTDLGEELHVPTGTLVLDRERDGWAAASAAALARCGHEVEWLEPADVARRFPPLAAEGVARAFFHGRGGVLRSGAILESLARHLAARGVELRPGTRATELDPDRPSVRTTGGETLSADAVVVAAGAWVTRLLPDLAQRLTPSRQVVVYLEPPAELAAAWSGSPMVLEIGPHSGFYLVPPIPGAGLKVGDHRFSMTGDPDAPRAATAQETSAVLAGCRGRIRDLKRYRIASAVVCFYTVEAQERFVVEPLGRAGWLVSACSGHAFKFGSVIGLRLAEAIDGRRDPAALARWAAGEID